MCGGPSVHACIRQLPPTPKPSYKRTKTRRPRRGAPEAARRRGERGGGVSEIVCFETECDRPIFAGGLCRIHYNAQRQERMPECSADECVEKQHAKGLCMSHYRAQREKKMPQCFVNGCEKNQHTKGLCSYHYNLIRPKCHIPGCNQAVTRGTDECDTHRRLRSAGERKCKLERCSKPATRDNYTLCESHHRSRHAVRCSESNCLWPQFCKVTKRCAHHKKLFIESIESKFELLKMFGLTGGYSKGKGYIFRSIRGTGIKIQEHRAMMMEHLGRDLIPGENVHHINGMKEDNRLENLELWNKTQPSGQRVVDKIEWATELLMFYAPERLSQSQWAMILSAAA